ncbi:isochorismatase family protein [Paraburkholderia sp. DHOC27]|uniref:isochorismatase family protein n=1 Tax=Paraburkholderia sp. DHOC27 TaxID=2303330 RepID=UPI000E3BB5D8|nr:isochorismatase family protein [Paraburkholderia sp. DHOC27]RFU43983.1 isochorismatase family protein [Paraburkholderia sp. DHOC27]
MAGVAVVVVDVQHAFFSGPNAAYRGDAVIDGINRLTAAARSGGVPVFIVQHEEPGDEVEYGSEGWELPDSLVRTDDDRLLRKSVGDSFHKTSLQAQLDALGVDRLLVCGFATEYCINTSIRSAALLGYKTTVISDLHTTQAGPGLTPAQIVEHHNWVWNTSSLQGNPVTVRPLAEVLATEFA